MSLRFSASHGKCLVTSATKVWEWISNFIPYFSLSMRLLIHSEIKVKQWQPVDICPQG